jgi:DNA processing protein
MARYGRADAALEALPQLAGGRPLIAPDPAQIRAELDALEAIGAQLLCLGEPDYPEALTHLEPPPPMLAVRGALRLFTRPAVAIVGARDASAAGQRMAQLLAADLAAEGYVIVSGLARGVDAAAHRAALAGGTVAVLAGGLDRPYPPQNLDLLQAIVDQGGAVVAEAPLGQEPRARDFPRRNHIISGLALGVVVIEAAQRSGSLITARAAADQGREVMAVPGSPLDPRTRGCNQLLRNGATLVETAADVIEALGRIGSERPRPLAPRHPPDLFTPPPGLSGRVAALLSPTPIHINDLARLLQVGSGQIGAALMELELTGRAASLPGGYAASASAAFTEPD